jgi:hypothetical protein
MRYGHEHFVARVRHHGGLARGEEPGRFAGPLGGYAPLFVVLATSSALATVVALGTGARGSP